MTALVRSLDDTRAARRLRLAASHIATASRLLDLAAATSHTVGEALSEVSHHHVNDALAESLRDIADEIEEGRL